MVSFWLNSALAMLAVGALQAAAFDINRKDNVVVYWGQNSYGATHENDPANWQKNLATYCQDDTIDVIPVAFLNVFFSTGGLPSLDLSNICNANDKSVFPGTRLPDCSFLAQDIQTCQSKGKIILLSLGGATGATTFSSAAQATAFGDTLWNLFFAGSSSTRPFGSAVLDGIDIDVEGGPGTQYWDSMINRLRTLASGAGRKIYVTAAPQCPYPDAYQQTVLNAVAIDAVFPQFYNNYCSLTNYPGQFDFNQWDTWARTVSVSKNTKVYIGALASATAGGSGYVDPTTLINIALAARSQYSSFGGVMLWDASQAWNNGRIDSQVKNAIRQSGGTTTVPTTPTTKPVTTTTTTQPTTTTVNSGSCAGVPAWVNNVAYTGGQQVVYNGHLWTAKWWTYGSTPGGSVGDWADNGACTSFAAAAPTGSAKKNSTSSKTA
ncbi:glycoside hydrolase [Fomes fomentarius]|nr:glycoside hydrolase [Fomes fomentarius]